MVPTTARTMDPPIPTTKTPRPTASQQQPRHPSGGPLPEQPVPMMLATPRFDCGTPSRSPGIGSPRSFSSGSNAAARYDDDLAPLVAGSGPPKQQWGRAGLTTRAVFKTRVKIEAGIETAATKTRAVASFVLGKVGTTGAAAAAAATSRSRSETGHPKSAPEHARPVARVESTRRGGQDDAPRPLRGSVIGLVDFLNTTAPLGTTPPQGTATIMRQQQQQWIEEMNNRLQKQDSAVVRWRQLNAERADTTPTRGGGTMGPAPARSPALPVGLGIARALDLDKPLPMTPHGQIYDVPNTPAAPLRGTVQDIPLSFRVLSEEGDESGSVFVLSRRGTLASTSDEAAFVQEYNDAVACVVDHYSLDDLQGFPCVRLPFPMPGFELFKFSDREDAREFVKQQLALAARVPSQDPFPSIYRSPPQMAVPAAAALLLGSHVDLPDTSLAGSTMAPGSVDQQGSSEARSEGHGSFMTKHQTESNTLEGIESDFEKCIISSSSVYSEPGDATLPLLERTPSLISIERFRRGWQTEDGETPAQEAFFFSPPTTETDPTPP